MSLELCQKGSPAFRTFPLSTAFPTPPLPESVELTTFSASTDPKKAFATPPLPESAELTTFSASTDLKKAFATPPLPESVELTTTSASTDLKKAFATPPLPESVEVEQTVELRCVPPAGEPAPSVSWTKNGVIVDPKLNPNYILSSEGSLLIVAAKLSDMANYSCVAENVANRRVSRPARLTVYGK